MATSHHESNVSFLVISIRNSFGLIIFAHFYRKEDQINYIALLAYNESIVIHFVGMLKRLLEMVRL